MAKKNVLENTPEPPPMQDEIRLTERQLCKFWSITVETLRKWRGNGYGPIYIKVGGRVLYRPEDIREFERQTMYRSSGQKIQYTGGDNGTQK